MNQRNRARAGSSARLADHGAAAIATSVIFALAENWRKSFSDLLREIGNASQSVLASTLAHDHSPLTFFPPHLHHLDHEPPQRRLWCRVSRAGAGC